MDIGRQGLGKLGGKIFGTEISAQTPDDRRATLIRDIVIRLYGRSYTDDPAGGTRPGRILAALYRLSVHGYFGLPGRIVLQSIRHRDPDPDDRDSSLDPAAHLKAASQLQSDASTAA